MKTKTIYIRSDLFCQIKPTAFQKLKDLVESGAKHSPCKYIVDARPMSATEFAIHYVQFSNQDIYNLLNKAIEIVKNTEEYVSYQLQDIFNDDKNKTYYTPPGTIRIFANDLICFYNGKTWRKLKP
jgi:hypothetical protein